MKRSDILTPIGMLLGIGLIVFAISQGNVGLAGFYDLVSVIITIGGSYAALLITFSLDEVKMMGTISKGLFKTPSMNKIDVINQFKETENISESLKDTNPLEWVRLMNNIKNKAEEIVLKELIYV